MLITTYFFSQDPLVQWLARGAVTTGRLRLHTLRSLVRIQYGSRSFAIQSFEPRMPRTCRYIGVVLLSQLLCEASVAAKHVQGLIFANASFR